MSGHKRGSGEKGARTGRDGRKVMGKASPSLHDVERTRSLLVKMVGLLGRFGCKRRISYVGTSTFFTVPIYYTTYCIDMNHLTALIASVLRL